MSYFFGPRRVVQLVMMLLTVLVLLQPRARAQSSQHWWFENVSEGNLIPGCVTGMTLAGFEFDPQGRPAVAWREENGCGGPPRVFWTRLEAGLWNRREFLSERRFQGGGAADHSHQFALRKGDGNPFILYADAGQFNEINTYVSDLGAHPTGGVSTYLESIVGPQNCDYTNYSLAFAAGDSVPQWVTGFALCNSQGSLRLNGTNVQSPLFMPRGSMDITPDGTRHVLWNSGMMTRYSRFPAGATSPDLDLALFGNINRFGGEVSIAAGPDGTLHAAVRGPDVDADWDFGAIVYLRSTDGGTTWTPYEYIDDRDDPIVNGPWNANRDLSLAIAADGVPAITYWRWDSELWYARRDGPHGTWTHQLVTRLPMLNQNRANQLRFDTNGDPVIAFYDPVINEMRLARPAPDGVTMPVDVSVTASIAPGVATPGAAATYTLKVTNKGVTNLDAITLSNQLPEGVTLVSAEPATGLGSRWEFSLTSGATRTFTMSVLLPFAEGTHVAVATVSTAFVDAEPGDNAATAAAIVKAEQCFIPHAPGDGLLGWFRGDGSAANSVAGHNGGGALNISYTAAAIGDGFSFNGTNSSVRINEANDNYYYPGTGPFSAQAYIRTTSAEGQIASRYECVSGNCTPTAWFWSVEAGHLSLYLRDRDNQELNLQGITPVNDGQLHHVAMVIDRGANEARLYVDGHVDVAAPLSVGDVSDGNGQTTSLMIGAYSDVNGLPAGFFNGVIDEFAVYSRALTDSEVAAITAVPSQPACATQLGAEDDLSVSIHPTPSSVAVGDVATFTVGVTNNGPVAHANVLLETHVSLATVIEAAPVPSFDNGSTQRFEFASLAPKETKWVIVRALAPLQPGNIFASASTPPGDADPSNDVASTTVPVVADACYVVTSDLIARWRFDDNPADSIGGRDAVLRGITSFEPGKKYSALSIGSASGYGEVQDAAELKPSAFTIAGWIKPSSTVGWDTLIAKGASGLDGNIPWFADTYWLGLAANGYPTLYTYDVSGSTTETKAAAPLATGRWYHLAATYDGSVARVFVDGVQVAESTIDMPLYYDVNAVPLTIGEDWQGGSPNGAAFEGAIDDVTVHGRALSGADIAAMLTGESSECINEPPNNAPVFTPPDNITTPATSVAGAVVDFAATGTDIEDGTIAAVCQPASGSTFAIGSTTVNCTVTDSGGLTASGSFTVTVTTGNHAPECLAPPAIPELWPPNHELVPISLNGITDSDGDPVTVRVTLIAQDEPTNTVGDGNTSSDADGIGTATPRVRSERSGTPSVPGNGRVYHIFYTVTDSAGASCEGTALVGVPHDQGNVRTLIDDGPKFNSVTGAKLP